MKKILIPLLLLFGPGPFNAIAQTGNFTDFLPLRVGNVWVYGCSVSCWGTNCYGGACGRRVRVIITNTNIINGRTYYQSQTTVVLISGNCGPGAPGCGAFPFFPNIRVDSLSANVLQYTTTGGCPWLLNETLVDSFKAKLNDSITQNCQRPSPQYGYYVCTDTNNVTIFGTSKPARTHRYTGFEYGWSRSYAKGIGLYATNYSVVCGAPGACYSSSSLRGCVINGIVYGDTSMLVGIKQISTEIPENFALYQNYPNPFNPVTKIKFDVSTNLTLSVAKGLIVSIKIYNILGREIATLVNEKLNPGTYEVEWDATNFPSGIYIYKLESENYSQSRRMVLIK